MDEKKILAEINFKEMQRREIMIRAEMRKLLDDTRRGTKPTQSTMESSHIEDFR